MLLRCTHSLLLRQMHMRSCGSRRNVKRQRRGGGTQAGGRTQMLCYIGLENAYGRAFRSTCPEAARDTCPQLAAICAAQWSLATRGFGRDVMMVGLLTARRGEASRVPGDVCALVRVCPFQVGRDGSARAHEDWPSGRNDIHWVGRSAQQLLERYPWPTLVTDFEATNVEFGRLGLNSSRTWNCRLRFATYAGGSHESDTASASLVLMRTCSTECM